MNIKVLCTDCLGQRQDSRLLPLLAQVVRDRPTGDGHPCNVQYAGEEGRESEAKCGVTVAAMRGFGFEPYGTNCSVLRFKEANGCEAQMTFVRRGDFDGELVRSYCTASRPHSCGPGSWSVGLAPPSSFWSRSAAPPLPAARPGLERRPRRGHRRDSGQLDKTAKD